MAVIYLKHPKHGTKVATMHLEAEADIKNGWSQYIPASLSASVGGLTESPRTVHNKLIPTVPAKKAE